MKNLSEMKHDFKKRLYQKKLQRIERRFRRLHIIDGTAYIPEDSDGIDFTYKRIRR